MVHRKETLICAGIESAITITGRQLTNGTILDYPPLRQWADVRAIAVCRAIYRSADERCENVCFMLGVHASHYALYACDNLQNKITNGEVLINSPAAYTTL